MLKIEGQIKCMCNTPCIDDKIRIPGDLESMLQAKVQISEKLRRDFYDILEKGKGADTINKELT